MNFNEKLIRTYGRDRAKQIEKLVGRLLEWAAEHQAEDGLNAPDYCQAYGIIQGMSIVLGYDSMGAINNIDSPSFWLACENNKAKHTIKEKKKVHA